MAHTYSHLFGIPSTALRFSNFYGPWGRPDMALFLFTNSILAGEPVNVFNHGKMQRDFTYIDEVVEGVVRVLDRVPQSNPEFDTAAPDPAHSWARYQVLSIGNHGPAGLLEYLDAQEEVLGKKSERNYLPMQPDDVQATFADITLGNHPPAEPGAFGIAPPSTGACRNPKSRAPRRQRI